MLERPVPEGAVAVDLPDLRDRELVQRIGDGDEEAFRALFRSYAPTALALARRVVRQPFLADEIVQEVFLALWRDPGGYDRRRGTVRAWLMGVVHHRSVDAVRREETQRRRAEELMVVTEDAAEEDPAEAVVHELGIPAEREAVRAALRDLPEEQRRVIELMYYEGLSQSRIAERLQIPLGTVKSRTLLGMRRLRGALVGMER